MSDKSFLLTIAIPTYNRAHYLEGLLTALFDELQNEPRVELLVSDNASSDNTPSIVAAFQARGMAIRSLRNDVNLGADRNILQCYVKATGKYAWVFSDDDLILPGSIKRLLDILSTGTYDIVNLIAAPLVDEDVAQSRASHPIRDRDCARPEELAGFVHVFFTFISGVILHKDRISSLPHRPFETLFDTNLAQLGPVYSTLNHCRRALVIREPLIAARSNSQVGYGLYRVFGTNFEKITREWVDNPRVRQAILNGTIRRFLPYWIMQSRESKASTVAEDPHQILRRCYGNNVRYWLFNYPLYALPLPLAKLWFLGIKIINKLETVLGGMLSPS